MTGFAQRFLEKGREEGMQQGMQQGIQQGMQRGEARILTAQLRLRFGDLADPVRARIESADADALLRWSERVLTARSLDEVLAD